MHLIQIITRFCVFSSGILSDADIVESYDEDENRSKNDKETLNDKRKAE